MLIKYQVIATLNFETSNYHLKIALILSNEIKKKKMIQIFFFGIFYFLIQI